MHPSSAGIFACSRKAHATIALRIQVKALALLAPDSLAACHFSLLPAAPNQITARGCRGGCLRAPLTSSCFRSSRSRTSPPLRRFTQQSRNPSVCATYLSKTTGLPHPLFTVILWEAYQYSNYDRSQRGGDGISNHHTFVCRRLQLRLPTTSTILRCAPTPRTGKEVDLVPIPHQPAPQRRGLSTLGARLE